MPDAVKPILADPELEASDDSDDEDYNPDLPKSANYTTNPDQRDASDADSGIEDNELGDYDSGDEKIAHSSSSPTSSKKRKRDEEKRSHAIDAETPNTESEGLIKTRSQRAQESRDATASSAVAPPKSTSTTDVDALWAAMNAPPPSRNAMSSKDSEDTKTETHGGGIKEIDVPMIQISRTYKFAGETHTESKSVPKDSQEARDYLASNPPSAPAPDSSSSLSKQADTNGPGETSGGKIYNGQPLRKVMKRKSILDPSSSSAGAKKINTLEKSRLEWSGFVDSEGINEDLKRGNKNGYLDKQDFLSQSESRRYSSWKAGQKKG